MFIVYKSNELDVLLSKVYQIIETKPLLNIFEKEIFIHDNKVLFQYLNIFIANKIGISANFKLYHPNDFIWKLLQKTSSKKELKNIFTHSIMTWKIMKILDEKNFEYFNQIKNKMNKFKFSFLMASIFKQYLLYRPDWINAWETEKNITKIDHSEKWQIKLWIEIMHNYKKNNQFNQHFSNLFYKFKLLIDKKKIKKKDLPKRCFLISSFSINPSYIKILKKISLYIDIYFLYITPCNNNIFNIVKDDKNFKKKIIEERNISYPSLITLWGQYEKIYLLYILLSKKIKIVNCFKNNRNNNLLNTIKNDFFQYNILQSNKIKKKDFYDLQTIQFL